MIFENSGRETQKAEKENTKRGTQPFFLFFIFSTSPTLKTANSLCCVFVLSKTSSGSAGHVKSSLSVYLFVDRGIG